MSNMFIRIQANVPPTVGKINPSDIDLFLPYDPEALAFWNFTSGSLVSANSQSQVLTAQGGYSLTDNALVAKTGGSNNLLTSYIESGEFSFSGVIDMSQATSAAMVIAGNFKASPESGAAIYLTGAGNVATRAASKVSIIDDLPDMTKPLFYAVSVNASVPSLSVVIKQPGRIDFSATGGFFPSPYVSSTSPLLIGSLAGGQSSNIKTYEFAIYNKALSLEALNRKYLESQVRMAGVGVKI